jgi:TIR domain
MDNESSFNVFLCHNSKDKPIVRAVAVALKAVGIECWLDEVDLIPGSPWKIAIANAVSEAKAAAIFISEQGFGNYQKEEVRNFLEQSCKSNYPVILVFLTGGNPDRLLESTKDRKLVKVIKELYERTWVDFNRGDDEISKLIYGITQKQPESSDADLAKLHYVRSYSDWRSKKLPQEIGQLSEKLSKLCNEYTETQISLQNCEKELERLRENRREKSSKEFADFDEYFSTHQENFIRGATDYSKRAISPRLQTLLENGFLKNFKVSIQTLILSLQSHIALAHQGKEDEFDSTRIVKKLWETNVQPHIQADGSIREDIICAYSDFLDYVCGVIEERGFSEKVNSQSRESADLLKKEILLVMD